MEKKSIKILIFLLLGFFICSNIESKQVKNQSSKNVKPKFQRLTPQHVNNSVKHNKDVIFNALKKLNSNQSLTNKKKPKNSANFKDDQENLKLYGSWQPYEENKENTGTQSAIQDKTNTVVQKENNTGIYPSKGNKIDQLMNKLDYTISTLNMIRQNMKLPTTTRLVSNPVSKTKFKAKTMPKAKPTKNPKNTQKTVPVKYNKMIMKAKGFNATDGHKISKRSIVDGESDTFDPFIGEKSFDGDDESFTQFYDNAIRIRRSHKKTKKNTKKPPNSTIIGKCYEDVIILHQKVIELYYALNSKPKSIQSSTNDSAITQAYHSALGDFYKAFNSTRDSNCVKIKIIPSNKYFATVDKGHVILSSLPLLPFINFTNSLTKSPHVILQNKFNVTTHKDSNNNDQNLNNLLQYFVKNSTKAKEKYSPFASTVKINTGQVNKLSTNKNENQKHLWSIDENNKQVENNSENNLFFNKNSQKVLTNISKNTSNPRKGTNNHSEAIFSANNFINVTTIGSPVIDSKSLKKNKTLNASIKQNNMKSNFFAGPPKIKPHHNTSEKTNDKILEILFNKTLNSSNEDFFTDNDDDNGSQLNYKVIDDNGNSISHNISNRLNNTNARPPSKTPNTIDFSYNKFSNKGKTSNQTNTLTARPYINDTSKNLHHSTTFTPNANINVATEHPSIENQNLNNQKIKASKEYYDAFKNLQFWNENPVGYIQSVSPNPIRDSSNTNSFPVNLIPADALVPINSTNNYFLNVSINANSDIKKVENDELEKSITTEAPKAIIANVNINAYNSPMLNQTSPILLNSNSAVENAKYEGSNSFSPDSSSTIQPTIPNPNLQQKPVASDIHYTPVMPPTDAVGFYTSSPAPSELISNPSQPSSQTQIVYAPFSPLTTSASSVAETTSTPSPMTYSSSTTQSLFSSETTLNSTTPYFWPEDYSPNTSPSVFDNLAPMSPNVPNPSEQNYDYGYSTTQSTSILQQSQYTTTPPFEVSTSVTYSTLAPTQDDSYQQVQATTSKQENNPLKDGATNLSKISDGADKIDLSQQLALSSNAIDNGRQNYLSFDNAKSPTNDAVYNLYNASPNENKIDVNAKQGYDEKIVDTSSDGFQNSSEYNLKPPDPYSSDTYNIKNILNPQKVYNLSSTTLTGGSEESIVTTPAPQIVSYSNSPLINIDIDKNITNVSNKNYDIKSRNDNEIEVELEGPYYGSNHPSEAIGSVTDGESSESQVVTNTPNDATLSYSRSKIHKKGFSHQSIGKLTSKDAKTENQQFYFQEVKPTINFRLIKRRSRIDTTIKNKRNSSGENDNKKLNKKNFAHNKPQQALSRPRLSRNFPKIIRNNHYKSSIYKRDNIMRYSVD